MSLAREVNVYLDKTPWFGIVKEDRQAAATTVYTALQAIDHLKTLLAPFLPFSAQKLHEALGYDGQLFGEQIISGFDEVTRSHEALIYDGSHAVGQWAPVRLQSGQALREPQALFRKLDEAQVLATEIVQPAS